MRFLTKRSLAVAAVAITAAGLSVAAASAAPGAGTFTKITTPATNLLVHYRDGAPNHFTVSGTASADVTSVDIECIYLPPTGSPFGSMLASAVPVTAGSFSATASISQLIANCRMRAIPTGETLDGYLGAYSGPLLTMWGAQTKKDGSTPYSYTGVGENAATIGILADAGECGVEAIADLPSPSVRLETALLACFEALPAGNLTPSGTSTASAVTVDGHNAYLPFGVEDYLRGSTLALPVTQTALSITATRAANGDVTFTERDPLVRCSISDTYPPTSGSCPALVSTGVTLARSLVYTRGGHQFRIRDTFVSSGGAHTLALQYNGFVQPPNRGKVGYSFPGRPLAFGAASPNTVVSGFGPGAHTMLVRSDLYAAADDPSADTVGFTWSKPPAFKFGGVNPNTFGMRYNLTVPAHGKAFLGFAVSEASLTKNVLPLARAAEADMMVAPTITTPKNKATLPTKSTTVKGGLVAGANGLPTSVKVNGHAATITVTSLTTAKYAVTFSEKKGKHKITVVARDNGGNTRSRSITVTNG